MPLAPETQVPPVIASPAAMLASGSAVDGQGVVAEVDRDIGAGEQDGIYRLELPSVSPTESLTLLVGPAAARLVT